MKYVFIVNPKSGKKEASGYVIPLIEAYFKGKNLDYEIKITQYAKHATQLAREAASENEQVRICSCGGDGTLSEVAAGLVGFDNAEFACFPCGSGNDYIKYFGTANDFSNIEQVVLGKSKVVDILRINDTYCLNLLSVGIDADVASYIPRIRRMPLVNGPMAYNAALVYCLLKKIGKHLTVRVDEAEMSGKFMLAAVGNGRVYGGGFYATPEAILDDGLLDVVAVNKISRFRIAKVVSKYKNGEHLKNGEAIDELKDCLTFFRGKKAEIVSDKEFALNIDGEMSATNHINIEIIPAALKFIIPLTAKITV